MRRPEHEDLVFELLTRLPQASPDPDRSARLVKRAHARMTPRGSRLSTLEPIVVGGFSLVYLAAILLDVLHWHGLI